MPKNPSWVGMCDRYFKDVLEQREKDKTIYKNIFVARKLDLILKNEKIMYNVRRIFLDYKHGNKSRQNFEIEINYLITSLGYSEDDAFVFIKNIDMMLNYKVQ